MSMVDIINAAVADELAKAGAVAVGINPGLAVLKAMRAPTPKMARAGKPATGSAAMSDWTWCAMIDAALDEARQP